MESINAEVLKHAETSVSLDQLVARYEISNRAEGKSPRTIHWYSEMLNQFLSYLEGQQRFVNTSDFNIHTVRDFILYLGNKLKYDGHPSIHAQNKHLSPQTVKCHVRALKAFSTWLYDEGHTSENNLMSLKLPRAPVKMIEPLTPKEIEKVSDAIDQRTYTGFRNYLILITALDNGLRASELAGITLGNISLKAGCIKVMGKGAKERMVPIGKFVTSKMWHFIDQLRPKPIDPECDRLFLSQDGKPISMNTIKLIFSWLKKKSGVVRLHAHLCRHTFAINYLLNGGDIFSLKEILGHSSLEMVNHYLHFTSSQITERHRKYSPMDHLQNVTN